MPATPSTTTDGRADEAPGLVYPCGPAPEAGHALEIAPGVLWLRMPLPWSLNHINLYALDDGAGWAVVDTAAQTPPALDAWQALLAPDGALGGRPITRVIATHMHPDHIGLAGWLTRRFDCGLWISRLEYLTCRNLIADTGREAPPEAVNFYRQAGWGEAALDRYRTRFGGFGKFVHAMPNSFTRLFDGQRLAIGPREWQVVVGHGHSPEHACLYCPELDVLISGDQVLPRISSNVSVHPTEPEADPLGDWLASLAKLRSGLPDTALVCPAHGEPFKGLHARLDRLASGHERSLTRLRRTLSERDARVVDTFSALFARPIDEASELLQLATGESLAHLNHLLRLGEARRELGADGVHRYRQA